MRGSKAWSRDVYESSHGSGQPPANVVVHQRRQGSSPIARPTPGFFPVPAPPPAAAATVAAAAATLSRQVSTVTSVTNPTLVSSSHGSTLWRTTTASPSHVGTPWSPALTTWSHDGTASSLASPALPSSSSPWSPANPGGRLAPGAHVASSVQHPAAARWMLLARGAREMEATIT